MEFHLFIQVFFLLCNKRFTRFSVKENVIFQPLSNKTSLPPVIEIPIIESKWDCGEVPF
jgi:hypothetical protein